MPAHSIKISGCFEMQLHVNRACFHAGLKSQTGMDSLRLSCERTLRGILNFLTYVQLTVMLHNRIHGFLRTELLVWSSFQSKFFI